jgi:hypothetical protein
MSSEPNSSLPKLPDGAIEDFLRVLEAIRAEQMPCSEVVARLDEYIDDQLGGRRAGQLRPLLQEHLEMCSRCREEYEALLSALHRDSGDVQAQLPQE